MASVVQQMKDRLDADVTLSAILTGKVWLRPFERNKTPDVFGLNQIHYNPAAYIVDGDVLPHFQSQSIPTAHNAVPEIRLIAAAHQGGKQAIRDATQRIVVLLHDWPCKTDYGPMTFFSWAFTTSIIDSEEFIGAVTSTVAFQRTGVYAVLT